MSNMANTEELIVLVERGMFQCDIPPVCCDEWEIEDWVEWIDNHGQWEVDDE